MARHFDATAKQRFLVQIGRGKLPNTTAEHMGFTWRTVQNHLRDDAEFAEGYRTACALVDERVEEVLLDTILEDRNVSSIKFYLTNRRPDRWQEMTKVAAVGGGSTTINVGVITTTALREVLTDPDQRDAAMDFLKNIPAIEATAREATGG